MSSMFFLVVGMILAIIGLLLVTAKVITYIKCTVPIHAAVVRLHMEEIHFRGGRHTRYRPVVEYLVDGKAYTEKAYVRTRQKTKYPIGSKMKLCYNPRNPKETRFVGQLFPLPMGLAFLLIGAALIFCAFF